MLAVRDIVLSLAVRDIALSYTVEGGYRRGINVGSERHSFVIYRRGWL